MTSFLFYIIAGIIVALLINKMESLDRKKLLEKHNFKDKDTFLNTLRYTILKQPEPRGTLSSKDIVKYWNDKTLQDIKELEDIIDFIKQNYALPKKYKYEVDDFYGNKKYQEFLFKKLHEIQYSIALETERHNSEYDRLENKLYLLSNIIIGYK